MLIVKHAIPTDAEADARIHSMQQSLLVEPHYFNPKVNRRTGFRVAPNYAGLTFDEAVKRVLAEKRK